MVWLITGASSGFGKELTLKLVAYGYRVIATARNPDDITQYLTANEEVLILPLDVTNKEQVKETVALAMAHFGQIDVLVNNAGIGYFSSIEEADEQAVRQLFEVNFWGVKNMIDVVLPFMRTSRTGHIINISSVGGIKAFAGFGYYHATKFALEGYSESLYQEVLPLGIHVTLIEPGDFTTDFAGRSAKENTTVIAEYGTTAGKNIQGIRKLSGHQPGNPTLAAEAIIQMYESPLKHPLRLLLGTDAYQYANDKIASLATDYEMGKELTFSTDY
ncbi:NADP-dependent 3-hydroxy acid dehydrogenase YdfG [Isobaculum melis]|uniref:NADP-dependent 3-hydroxy acid dehydrogenase YdfG n=2 Tax=Isobaculum melis TaxID=142588 RepID=A0A1H9R889_9LACT|nr:NADP-dependent 3-hydroxy acid dehydrogenase YdfG [Isobaculum melis]